MANHSIPEQVFPFLQDLSQNNNRDWFNEHKGRYTKAHEHVIGFADELLDEMRKHDNIETLNGKKSLFRIYRDVRFSKNKEPYKVHWAGGFKRATARLRGGYYFHLKPGEIFVAGGFWGPNKEDLLRIRQEIEMDDSELRAIISAPEFVETFGQLDGEELKTAPKGFDREHPAIDLIRKKQFIVTHRFPEEIVNGPNLAHEMNKAFKIMRPFLDYMSDVLTTDANGVSIV
jgi:uncharacterized protein (TIGR02453 family)